MLIMAIRGFARIEMQARPGLRVEPLLAYVTVRGAGVDSYSPRIRASIGQLSECVTDDIRISANAWMPPWPRRS